MVQWIDNQNYIQGIEYLSAFHEKLRLRSSPIIVLSGDSTTEGNGISDPYYKVNSLIGSFLNSVGHTANIINSGHSGQTSEQWISSYLAADLAVNPDLYVLRWGINDGNSTYLHHGSDMAARVSEFESHLRAGLSVIRSAKPVEALSVILMMPNSTSDTPNGRDEEWYSAIRPMLKSISREFQCCFIDTYIWMEDSRFTAGWGDNPYGDGRHIHPNNVGNTIIVSLLSEVLCPTALRSTNLNVPGNTVLPGVNLPPSSWQRGQTIYRALAANGWPRDGAVVTHRHVDGPTIQFNYAYQVTSRPQDSGFAVRIGIDEPGVPAERGWGPWLYLYPPSAIPLSLQNGWTSYSALHSTPAIIVNNSVVTLQGLVKGGATAPGTIIGNIPVQYRPAKVKFFATVCNGQFGSIQVASDGNIQIVAVPGNTYLSLDGLCYLIGS